ncbi:MAG: putative ABC transport system permease protein [Pseudohongiellaceae bacterium]|jgi:putative ABC transport system permease protein
MNGFTHLFAIAFQALKRNRVQTTLAMLGVTVGVCALVTSMALAKGAQEAIREQLLAAGANMIVVTAGNYQIQRAEGVSSPADHGSIESPSVIPFIAQNSHSQLGRADLIVSSAPRFIQAHFEDDPMAIHDHPTASDRLGDSMAGLGAAATLTLEDAETIRSTISGVQFVASGVHENARITVVSDETKQWFTRLHGTESELPVIRRGWTFPYGEFFTPQQVLNKEQVMVLGRVVADRLFGQGINPLGQEVLLWNQPFEVVGVVGSRSWASQPVAGDDQFDAVYVPVSTVHSLLNLSKLNTITVTTKSAGETTNIAQVIVNLLRQRHGISDQMPDDFIVKSQAQELLGDGLSPDLARIVAGNLATMDTLTLEQLSKSLQRANNTMLILLAGVAGVSLLVGGIGVMNLLLLSVTERTREVGLRMALGARGSDIALQFITEAVLLSLLGGLLGTVIAVFATMSLEGIFQWSTEISLASIVIAIIVAALLGVAASVYPARRAAELEPISALQHE